MCVCLKAKGQLYGVCSLLSLGGFQGLNSGHQPCMASVFPARPSCQLTEIVCIAVSACSLIFSFSVSNPLLQIRVGVVFLIQADSEAKFQLTEQTIGAEPRFCGVVGVGESLVSSGTFTLSAVVSSSHSWHPRDPFLQAFPGFCGCLSLKL